MNNKETTLVLCRFELTRDQVLNLFLNELGSNPKFDLSEFTSKAKVTEFCKFKITQHGERVFKVLSSNQLLLLKQDVVSKLKGVI